MSKTEKTLRAAIRGAEQELDDLDSVHPEASEEGYFDWHQRRMHTARTLDTLADELDFVEQCRSAGGHDWELVSYHPDTRCCVVCGIMREPDGE